MRIIGEKRCRHHALHCNRRRPAGQVRSPPAAAGKPERRGSM